METGTIYIYDGTIQGLLTAIGKALETDRPVAGICRSEERQAALFAPGRRVFTNRTMAERLWKKLEKKSSTLQRLIYFSFLSEEADIEFVIYKYLNILFNQQHADDTQFPILRRHLERAANRAGLEKKEFEQALPFAVSLDGVPCAWVRPAHNILPLLTRHFKSRFTGQAWLAYDARRNYGIYWHGGQLELVSLRPEALALFTAHPTSAKVGDPEPFRQYGLSSLLLPKVVQNPRQKGEQRRGAMRSAV